MKIITYARVSTSGETLETLIEHPTKEGHGQIFKETVSGLKSDHAEPARALAVACEDDVFVDTRLDRLARSAFDRCRLSG